jgi:hypothetical protein
MKPKFITFTGLDDSTDLKRVVALSQRYPIEWGILLGRESGIPRFPSAGTIATLRCLPVRRALHLCGPRAKEAREGLASVKLACEGFSRIQVNGPDYGLDEMEGVARALDRVVIVQWRGEEFPAHRMSLRYLFDRSAGQGIQPSLWPRLPHNVIVSLPLCGYAGGIGPENVISVVNQIAADGPYWLDMESGVRTGDAFDLDKCEAVCRALWGEGRGVDRG